MLHQTGLSAYTGPRPRPGSAGLADALATFRAERAKLHRRDPRILIREADLDAAATLVARLAEALAPLEGLGPKPRRFSDVTDNVFYWNFVVLAWLPLYFLLDWVPRL